MFAQMPWTRRSALLPEMGISERFGTLVNRLLSFPDDTSEWPNRWGLTTEENEKEFLLRFELPGFDPAEVKVELAGDRLLVEAEHRPPDQKPEERTEHIIHVKRAITLPPGANLEQVGATYRNGVLEVCVPRAPETLGRRIEVKT